MAAMIAVSLLERLDKFIAALGKSQSQKKLTRARKRLAYELTRYWNRQGARAVNEMLPRLLRESHGGDERALDKLNSGEDMAQLQAQATRARLVGITVGLSDGGKLLRLISGFDVSNPAVAKWLESEGARFVSEINTATRDTIRRILIQAAKEGWGYSKTAAAIKSRFTEFGLRSSLRHIRNRAELVAVTEVGNAYEEGKKLVAEKSGLLTEKRWMTVGDARVDPDHCAPNGSQGWIAEAKAFASGHYRPLAHPGCRCACTYRAAVVV